MPVLSRAEMEQAIQDGGSVLHGGRLYSRIEDLPSAADLARGNPEQEAAAAAALDSQIAALQAQRAQLGQAGAELTFATTPVVAAGDHPFDTIVGQPIADKLMAAGYATPEAISAASDEQLLAIDGVGPKSVKALRDAYGGG